MHLGQGANVKSFLKNLERPGEIVKNEDEITGGNVPIVIPDMSDPNKYIQLDPNFVEFMNTYVGDFYPNIKGGKLDSSEDFNFYHDADCNYLSETIDPDLCFNSKMDYSLQKERIDTRLNTIKAGCQSCFDSNLDVDPEKIYAYDTDYVQNSLKGGNMSKVFKTGSKSQSKTKSQNKTKGQTKGQSKSEFKIMSDSKLASEDKLQNELVPTVESQGKKIKKYRPFIVLFTASIFSNPNELKIYQKIIGRNEIIDKSTSYLDYIYADRENFENVLNDKPIEFNHKNIKFASEIFGISYNAIITETSSHKVTSDKPDYKGTFVIPVYSNEGNIRAIKDGLGEDKFKIIKTILEQSKDKKIFIFSDSVILIEDFVDRLVKEGYNDYNKTGKEGPNTLFYAHSKSGMESEEYQAVINNVYNCKENNWKQVEEEHTDIDPNTGKEIKKKLIRHVSGSKIRILIGSKVLSVGLSLTCVRLVLELKTINDNNVAEQVLGRVIRDKSHLDLPKELRNVSRYIILNTFSEKVRKDVNGVIRKYNKCVPLMDFVNEFYERELEIITIDDYEDKNSDIKFKNNLKISNDDLTLLVRLKKEVVYKYVKMLIEQVNVLHSFNTPDSILYFMTKYLDKDEMIVVLDKLNKKLELLEDEAELL
jgi:hypothetical protein